MSDLSSIIVVLLAVMVVAFLLTALYLADQLLKWRIRWIELEHDLARAESRKPRNINEIN